MRNIEMVDLVSQYHKLKEEIDSSVMEVMSTASFINGPAVKKFTTNLENYIGDGAIVIPCANGTDALQISMMALGLQPGDEVITPSFTYAATAEVIALLKLVPRFVDVKEDTFNIDPVSVRKAITPKTKAIVPVHLFGQAADMEAILQIAEEFQLYVIEDVAQAIGSSFTFSDGRARTTGTMGHIAGTSFFPSKNLGCFGDGGAIITTHPELADKCRMIANHGQTSLYYHTIVGVNSRLDSMQAAVLDVKLKNLNSYIKARREVAAFYNNAFKSIDKLTIPFIDHRCDHVFHQYTLKVNGIKRDELKEFLESRKIPAKIYYPVPLHLQKAYNLLDYAAGDIPVSEKLCEEVISLPMHTELDEEQLNYIVNTVIDFCNK